MTKKTTPKAVKSGLQPYPIVEEGGENLAPTEPFDAPQEVLRTEFESREAFDIYLEERRIRAFDLSEDELVLLAASHIVWSREVDSKFQELHYQLHSLIPALMAQKDAPSRQIVAGADLPILEGLKAVLKASDALMVKTKDLSRLEVATKGAQARAKAYGEIKTKVLEEYQRWRDVKKSGFSKTDFAYAMIEKHHLDVSVRTITESWLKEI